MKVTLAVLTALVGLVAATPVVDSDSNMLEKRDVSSWDLIRSLLYDNTDK